MISAQFSSKCPGCGGDIEEGERIGLVDGDWCCELCVEEYGEDSSSEAR